MCLNDYHPVTLVFMIIIHDLQEVNITQNQIAENLKPLIAWYSSRHMDVIYQSLHLALEHLDNKHTYTRLLFIDCSHLPHKSIKLMDGVSNPLCS